MMSLRSLCLCVCALTFDARFHKANLLLRVTPCDIQQVSIEIYL